jgi:aconitate hydratase
LVYGPNIADWPEQIALTDNILLKVVTVIKDEVTTTDELIPSGEASSYRSNPLKLAEFTLSRKAPYYVKKAKEVLEEEKLRRNGGKLGEEYENAIKLVGGIEGSVSLGSTIYANRPGDGSAREQAASCQRVLGGLANIAKQYATKRYRSNLINWGMIPFIYDNNVPLEEGDIVIVKNVHAALEALKTEASVVRDKEVFNVWLTIDHITGAETDILKAGCLINKDRE